ncbi:MAG: phage terminase large subunit [Ferrovibrio sp.]|uniref:phage terminase large subunit n=1 Tax=Ferrovibrio sp. TaxID=1917215 RepID=UPI0039195AE7
MSRKDHLLGTTAATPSDPLKADFRKFLWLVWRHLNLPEPTPVQYDIARYLQHGPKRCIIEAFRGVGKSWVTSAFVCWLLYCNPQLNILVVSASKIRADDFTTFTLRLIHEMPELQHLKPREGQRQSKVAFDVGPARASHAPSVKSVGITGQIAGSRADVIIADDIEVPNNSATQMMRDKLAEAVKEFDAVLKPGGRVIYLGTPQTEQSLYNVLPERGYEVRVWPARFPDEKQRERYGNRLAPFIADQLDRDLSLGERRAPTDIRRFSDHDLMEREASYGRSGFALQFMLDTSLSDADKYPLKLADLIVMSLNTERAPAKVVWASSPELVIPDIPNVGFNGDRYYRPAWIAPEWAEYTGSVMAIDPAGRGSDEVGVAIVKMLHSMLFVLECTGFRGGYSEENLKAIAMLARLHKVNKVIIEPNFGDGMFNQLLKPVMQAIYPVTIEDAERSNTQKERRIIDTLEPVMNQHRLVFDRAVIERDFKSTEDRPSEDVNKFRLMYQLTRITKDKGALVKDDRLDALALAVHYWVEQMNRSTDQALRDHREALRDAELERFMENVFGAGHSNGPSWFAIEGRS